MTTLFRLGLALVLAVSVAGCATRMSATPTAAVTPARTKLITADRVKDIVVIGKSTKADVIAALGETLAISFDSGYEVWVYRLSEDTRAKAGPASRMAWTGSKKPAPGESEFVILFAPSGLVSKSRIRTPPT